MKRVKIQPAQKPAISEKEIEKRIETARLQERASLQEEIASAKKEARIARKKLIKLEGASEAMREVQTPDGVVDIEDLLNRAHRKWRKLSKDADPGDEATTTRLKELEDKLQKYELRALRKRLIAEAGGAGAMITEMVGGSTEEEIEASIAKAVAAFKRYAKGKKVSDEDSEEDEDELSGDDASDEDEESDESEESDEDEDEEDEDEKTLRSGKGRTRQAAPVLPNAASSASGGRGKSKGPLKDVKSLTPAQFAERRVEILGALKKNYSPGASPFNARRHGGR